MRTRNFCVIGITFDHVILINVICLISLILLVRILSYQFCAGMRGFDSLVLKINGKELTLMPHFTPKIELYSWASL